MPCSLRHAALGRGTSLRATDRTSPRCRAGRLFLVAPLLAAACLLGTMPAGATTTPIANTVAGDGIAAYAADGGFAWGTEADAPGDVAVDGAGDVFIADTANNRIRMIPVASGTYYGQSMAAGAIYTIAGAGTVCSTHTVAGCSYNGPATSAKLDAPSGVAVDSSGDVFVADTSNNWIGMIPAATGTYYGISMTADSIYDIAGTGTACTTHTVAGCVYDAAATSAKLDAPSGVAVDSSGDVFVADTTNQWVGMLAKTTRTNYGISMTANSIYDIAGTGTACATHTVAGCVYNAAATSSKLDAPRGVAVDGSGNVFVADTTNQWIGMIANSATSHYGISMTANSIYDIVGTGTACATHTVAGCVYNAAATSAKLDAPGGVAVDSSGNVYVADTTDQWVGMLANSTTTNYGISMTANSIYDVAGTGTAGYLGDGGGAESTAFNGPSGVAVDAAGDVFVADTANNRIRMIPASSGTYYGQSMIAGDAYTIAGTGTACATHTVAGCSYNAPATSAKLDAPNGVAVDSSGDVFVADTTNNWIGMIANSTTTNYGISMTADSIYDIAGTGAACAMHTVVGCVYNATATSAKLDAPSGVAVDSSGDVFVADTTNNWVGMLARTTRSNYGISMTANSIYDIAGTGAACAMHTVVGCMYNGPATAAQLGAPSGVAVDSSGDVFVADTTNNWIGMLANSTATDYGISMTANSIYDIAGTGAACGTHTVAGCVYNAAATSAKLDAPHGVAVDSSGDVFVADTTDQWIGMLANSTTTNYGISMTANSIYDIFGSGTACATITGACGDSGAGTSAMLSSPSGVAVLGSGTLLVADKATNRVRELVVAPTLLNLPAALTFPNYPLPGVDGVSDGVLSIDLLPSTFSVSSAPWSLAITSTSFSSSGHSLSTGATTVSAPAISCDAAFACVQVAPRTSDPSFPLTIPAGATAPTATTLFSDQTGTGPQTLSFTFVVAIPADAYAGTYDSTWTITDQSGP